MFSYGVNACDVGTYVRKYVPKNSITPFTFCITLVEGVIQLFRHLSPKISNIQGSNYFDTLFCFYWPFGGL